MSSFNCCFLTCIQISQEADKVVWYSHLFKNFHSLLWSTVKGPQDGGVKGCVLIFSCKNSKITTHFLLNLPCLLPLLDPDTLDSPTPEDGGSQRRSHWSSGLTQLFDSINGKIESALLATPSWWVEYRRLGAGALDIQAGDISAKGCQRIAILWSLRGRQLIGRGMRSGDWS